MLAALVLTVHNLREARQAEHFSGETAAKLTEEISRRRTAREAEPERKAKHRRRRKQRALTIWGF